LRDDVLGQTGLSVSVGIAPNKFLAKLASKHAKPDGMVLIHPDKVDEFLCPLPVEALWGVGTETASVLKRFGLRTIGDVACLPQSSLERALGSLGGHIARLARGVDDRGVVADSPRKSMGAEETFERDLTDTGEILRFLLKLSDRVASRLRARGISGQTVTLKVRFSNFTTITRSVTLPAEVDGTRSIYLVVRDLISRVLSGGGASGHPRIRLLGVSLSNLKDWPPSEQLSFDPAAGWSDADRTLDLVRRRFGEEAIEFGVLLESPD
jgi:DNA polymerase-4